MRIARTIVALLLVCSVLAVPASALAGDLPDAIDDPVEAVAPQPEPTPSAPAPAAPTAQDAADSAPTSPTPRATAAQSTMQASTATTVGSGSLPFTGVDDGRIALLLIVGSLAACAGVTAIAWARSFADA